VRFRPIRVNTALVKLTGQRNPVVETGPPGERAMTGALVVAGIVVIGAG
jgi:hypothetical protein